MGQGWRIVVFNNLPVALPIIDNIAREQGHRIVGVVATHGPRGRRTSTTSEILEWTPPAVDLIVTNFPNRLARMLEPLNPDLIVCVGFPWKVPEDVLKLPRLGVINGHPSALPKYRGPGPMVASWLFLNDEPEATWTVHRMDAEFDTGAILAQRTFPIRDDDDFEALADRTLGAMPEAFREAFEALARDEEGTPQNLEDGFYVDWLTDDQRRIDWSQPARSVHNQVRAWHGWEIPRGALGQIDQSQAVVTRTRLIDKAGPSNTLPGTVVERRAEGTLLVQCGDKPLEILEWSAVD
jgi:methionyl-tRNA formyltransferase